MSGTKYQSLFLSFSRSSLFNFNWRLKLEVDCLGRRDFSSTILMPRQYHKEIHRHDRKHPRWWCLKLPYEAEREDSNEQSRLRQKRAKSWNLSHSTNYYIWLLKVVKIWVFNLHSVLLEFCSPSPFDIWSI